MIWQDVVSSNIDALSHKETTLWVRFKGGRVYSYPNVTVEIFQSLRDAPSVGKAFQTVIRANSVLHPPTALS